MILDNDHIRTVVTKKTKQDYTHTPTQDMGVGGGQRQSSDNQNAKDNKPSTLADNAKTLAAAAAAEEEEYSG